MIEWLIEWRPTYRLKLTSEHTAVLTKLAALHYSGECIAAGKPGGFLWGWTNQAAWAADPAPSMSDGSSRQLDICLKIMEMSDCPGLLDDSERKVRDELRETIRTVLAAGNLGRG